MVKKEVFLFVVLFLLFGLITGCKETLKKENTVNINTLWKNKENYLEKEAIVKGVIKLMFIRCTGETCTEQNPCCQNCGSDLGFIISDNDQLPFFGEFAGKEITCSGTNCELNCYPFETEKDYKVKISLHKDKFSRYYMSLIGIIKND